MRSSPENWIWKAHCPWPAAGPIYLDGDGQYRRENSAPGGVSYRYDVKFVGPVRFGDTGTTGLKVVEKNVERREIIFQVITTNQRVEKVLEGKTTLKGKLRYVRGQDGGKSDTG